MWATLRAILRFAFHVPAALAALTACRVGARFPSDSRALGEVIDSCVRYRTSGLEAGQCVSSPHLFWTPHVGLLSEAVFKQYSASQTGRIAPIAYQIGARRDIIRQDVAALGSDFGGHRCGCHALLSKLRAWKFGLSWATAPQESVPVDDVLADGWTLEAGPLQETRRERVLFRRPPSHNHLSNLVGRDLGPPHENGPLGVHSHAALIARSSTCARMLHVLALWFGYPPGPSSLFSAL